MKQHELFGKTRRLFDEDAYISAFEANVISCEPDGKGRFTVILDRTAFFPEAGGQPADRGTIAGVQVIDVTERDGGICHITDSPVYCGKVSCEVDFPLRYERMRNHSGEHLLSGFAHRLFGCTNVGFHLNDETVTVDFDRQLTTDQLMTIEAEVNRAIAENARITAYYPTPEELVALDYRSKLELTENVRIVEIDGYDLCACCAPHVASTGEIGSLIITDSINYKGGTRLTMVCGLNAWRTARTAVTNTREIAGMLSAKSAEAAQAVERFMGQNNEEKAKYSVLCSAYIDLRLAQIEPGRENILLFEPALDRNSLRRLVDRAADMCTGMAAGFTGDDQSGWTYIIISRTVDLKTASNSLNRRMNGRGGGSPQMIQGTAKAPREVLEKLFD